MLSAPPLELRVRSRPASVTEARKTVAKYAEAAGANSDDVALAVAEGVANAVVHAFPGRADGAITLRAEVDGPDYFVVEIADFGSGITTRSRSPRAGFGLPIIGAVTDGVEIRTGDPGTRLVLRFRRAS
jgi:serine/threonine-protein kinase RsbW